MPDGASAISPGQLADELDGLRIRLGTLHDSYARLYELNDFFSTALRHVSPPTLAIPFLLELHDELLAATAFISPPEANPERLASVLKELNHWRSLVPAELSKGWDLVLERIQLEMMVAAAMVGDFAPALDLLGGQSDDFLASGNSESNARMLLKRVEVSRPGWSDAVERRIKTLPIWDPEGTTARFPAVYAWSERDARTRTASRGFLCPVSFRIWRWVDGDDELSISQSSNGAPGNEQELLTHVATAGRHMLQELAPEALGKGYRGSFTIHAGLVRLEGGSMRSLLAILYALEVIRFRDRRVAFQLDPATVISGDIDARGQLLPFDVSSIPRKVEAAFFSGTSQLIIPHEHLTLAREALERLQNAYPLRRLSIHAAESIFDVFADRRIVRRREISRSRYAIRRMWQKRTQLTISTLTILLLLSAFLLYPTKVDPHVVNHFLEDGSLHFANSDGQVVHTIPLSSSTWRDMQSKGARHVAIADVNGDGLNEMFWVIRGVVDSGTPGRITSMDGASGDTLMVFFPDFELDYPGDLSISSNAVMPQDIAILDTDGNGTPELLATFEHIEFYPSILASIDPLNGAVLQRYDHPGALRELIVGDANQDGKEEILVSGVNNSMRKPIFAVLDPADFSDTGPVSRESYRALPERVGKELAYYSFPESPISGFSPPAIRMADWINILASGIVTVSVLDAYHVQTDGYRPASYRVRFNHSLQPISIGSGSDWDNVWDQAANIDLVPREFSNEIKMDMLSKIERIR